MDRPGNRTLETQPQTGLNRRSENTFSTLGLGGECVARDLLTRSIRRSERHTAQTPGLESASGRSSDFTCLLAVYATRTYGGVGGPPREGRSYPVGLLGPQDGIGPLDFK